MYSDELSYVDKMSMGLPIVHFKGSLVEYPKYNVFLSLNVVLILANSADPDEMQHYAAFLLGLHFLPKYRFRGFQYAKPATIFYVLKILSAFYICCIYSSTLHIRFDLGSKHYEP